jgi:hypothetical protein
MIAFFQIEDESSDEKVQGKLISSKSLCGTPIRYQCGYDWHTPSDDSQSEDGEVVSDADDEDEEKKENIDPAAVSLGMIYVSLLCLICKSKKYLTA